MTQDDRRARPPTISLEDLLLRHGAIDQEQLKRAKEEQKKWGGDLGRTLVDLGFISEVFLMRAVAHQRGIPHSDPAQEPLDPSIVRALGVQLCERYGVIAIAGDLKRRELRVATSEPGNAQLLREVASTSGYKIAPATATTDSIARAIRKYFYGETTETRVPVSVTDEEPEAEEPQVIAAEESEPATSEPSEEDLADSVLTALSVRVFRLEQSLAKVKPDAAELSANPDFAGLAARVERLEQLSSNDVATLRVVCELLLEKGLLDRDELVARLKQRKS